MHCSDSANWDVDSLTEQILAELNGAVSSSTIQDALSEVLPRYDHTEI